MEQRIVELRARLGLLQNADGSFACRCAYEDEILVQDGCLCSSSLILPVLHADRGSSKAERRLSAYVAKGVEHYQLLMLRGQRFRGGHGGADRLDISCAALAGLTLAEGSSFSQEVLTRAVLRLTEAETDEGGPYRTWAGQDARAPHVENAVDPVVNANIAYFLGLHSIRLPKLDAYLDEVIRNGSYVSVYYPSEHLVIYALARAYEGARKDQIRARLLERREDGGGWGNALHTALAVTSLINIGDRGEAVRRGIEILSTCDANEVFRAEPCFKHPLKSEGWCSHEAITITHCLEAFARYEQMDAPDTPDASVRQENPNAESRDAASVIALVEERISTLSEPLHGRAHAFLHSLVARDRDGQIVSFPVMVHGTLRQKSVSEDTVLRLSAANVYGWMAYTIFDDFLDREGDPSDVSVAAFSLRELAGIYETFNPMIRGLFRHTMDLVDAVNAWELAYARTSVANGTIMIPEQLPAYGDVRKLAERSLGHALGPLTILLLSGFAPSSPEVAAVKAYVVHMLSAKQLCDDVEDWEEDLCAGRLNFVVADLLERWKRAHDSASGPHPLEEIVSELRLLFWREALPGVSRIISTQAEQARVSIAHAEKILEPGMLDGFLEAYERTAAHLLTQRDERLALLAEL